MSSKKSKTNVCTVDENLNEVKASTSNKTKLVHSTKFWETCSRTC